MLFKNKTFYPLKLSLDLLVLNLFFLLSAIIAQSSYILFHRNYMFVLLAILNILWYFTANRIGLYEDFSRGNFLSRVSNILQLVLIQSIVSVLFIFLVKEDLFTRNFLILFSFGLFLGITIRVVIIYRMMKTLRLKGINLRRLVIIGTDETAVNFKEMIDLNPGLGYFFEGFIAENNTTIASPEKKDLVVLGDLTNFDRILHSSNATGKSGINEAIIALPSYSDYKIEEIIRICNKYAIRAHIIPDYFRFLSQRFQVNAIGSFPIITVRNEPLEQAEWRIIKRLFDIFISILTFIFLLWWFFPALIIIQKLSSPGPVFYIQDRIGRNGKLFKCYKFRTMKPHSAQAKFTPTSIDDDRITKFGRFLRSSNLDEFPQLINVFLGDMSIVGPRPHAVAFDKNYEEFVEEIRLRNLVKPGITGWAQAHGLRGDAANEEENKKKIKTRIAYDIWYIENWSFGLDLQIIFLTAWQIFSGRIKGH